MTKEELMKYARELAQKSGLAPEAQEGFLKALEQDEFAKSLGDAVARQSDYSRRMDELKAQEEAIRKAGAQDYYEKTWMPQWNQLKSERDAEATAAQRYRELYGELPAEGGGHPTLVASPAQGDFISKKDFTEAMEKRDQQVIHLLTNVPVMTVRHYQEFGEVLDTNALKDFTLKSGLPLDVAYDKFVADKRHAKTDADFAAKLEAAKEEGRKEVLTKHKLPIDTSPRDVRPHPFFDRKATPQLGQPTGDRERFESFAEAWQEGLVKPATSSS